MAAQTKAAQATAEAAQAAAQAAAQVLAAAAEVAAQTAGRVAAESPVSVALEHRLTQIEAAQAGQFAQLMSQNNTTIDALGELKSTILTQNGRVTKLEAWRTQVTTIYGALLVAAPFVFYGLTKLFGN